MRFGVKSLCMVAVAVMVLGACGGGDTPGDSTDALPATGGQETRPTDLCSVPLPTDQLALEAAAGTPAIGDDGSASTLGPDGVATILDQVMVSGVSVCALDVSPHVQAVIDEVRAASARGDRAEVRSLLEQLIRVDLLAAAPPVKSFRGTGASSLQKVRDDIAAAAEAYHQGEDDLGDEAMDRAREHFTSYARDAIPGTEDVGVLLTIAAEAQLLGLDEIADDAMDKARDIVERELEAIANRYEPCTATLEETNELVAATALVQMHGGDSESGDALIRRYLEFIVDRANGRPVPECEGYWAFAMTTDIEDVTFLWDGVFTVRDGRIEGSGDGTLLGSGRCVVTGLGIDYTGPRAEVTGTFTFDLAGTTSEEEGAEFFSLLIDSSEAEIEFIFEDPVCGGWVDILRDFLSQVPTFPSFVPNAEVQVSDGYGTADLAIDPYIFEMEVTQLGDQ